MTEKQAKLLAYPFTADEIEWRILLTAKDKSKGQVAAYIDSRAIQKRLDDVLGRELEKPFHHNAGQLQQHNGTHLRNQHLLSRPAGMDHQK